MPDRGPELLDLTRVLERWTLRVGDVLTGQWSGLNVDVFEYEYEVPSGPDSNSVRHRQTCVAARIANGIGPLAIAQRTLLSGLGAKLSMSELPTADREFDARFIVSSPRREIPPSVLTQAIRSRLVQDLRGAEVLIGYGHILWMSRRGDANALEQLRRCGSLARLLPPAPPASDPELPLLTESQVEAWDGSRRASRNAARARDVATIVVVIIAILILLPVAAGIVFMLSCSSGRCI